MDWVMDWFEETENEAESTAGRPCEQLSRYVYQEFDGTIQKRFTQQTMSKAYAASPLLRRLG